MTFKTKTDLSADKVVTLGGLDKTTGKKNPGSIEGFYLGSRVTPDKGYGPGLLHFFQTEEGNVGVWGKTRMNNLLTKELSGQMVRVTFTGMSEKRKGRNPSYMYKVEHDEESRIDVSNINLSSVSVDEEESPETFRASGNNYQDVEEETELNEDEQPLDEQPVPRAAAPRRPLSQPDAARQAKVQALLNGSKFKAS